MRCNHLPVSEAGEIMHHASVRISMHSRAAVAQPSTDSRARRAPASVSRAFGCGMLLVCSALAAAAEPEAPQAAAPTRAVRLELNRAESLLRQQLGHLPEGSGAIVVREPARLILRLPARLLFPPDAVTLRGGHDEAMLVALMRAPLLRRGRLSAQVTVYTDSIGGPSLNQSIAAQRAATLGAVLVGSGIDSSRLQIRGVGASEALASNATPVGREQNRRIEVVYAAEDRART
jgi:outer membrane protein OmpA-like peptidoglycan-associated protein